MRSRLVATLATVGCAMPALVEKKTAISRHPVARKSPLNTRKERSIWLTIAALWNWYQGGCSQRVLKPAQP